MRLQHKPNYLRRTFITCLGLLLLLLCLCVVEQSKAVPINPLADTRQPNIECANGFYAVNACPPGLIPNAALVITLTGASSVSYVVGDTYAELGATCTDTEDTLNPTVPAPSFSPALNMAVVGEYTATYTCTDLGSLTDTVTRTVYVNAAAGVLAFSNANLSSGTEISQVFWAGMPDVNGDGCLDIYIGSHEDVVNSNMHIQDNVGGVCQGTFTFYPDNNNYSQGTRGQPDEYPRITSRYIWGNWYGHPEGFWSFYGADVDGSASARYVLDPTFTTVGGQPQYLAKTNGCFGARPKCLPLDIDGDNNFEMASKLFDTPHNTGYIVDINDGTTIYPSNGQNATAVGALAILDVNNDGVPEVVAPTIGGYFEFNAVSSEMDWVASFTGGLPNASTTGNHYLALDYDNDGDLDIYVGEGVYNVSGSFQPFLFQNDGAGNFTNVTTTALAGISLANTAYHSTYGNSQVGDINLDGHSDIIYCSEEFDDTVVFLVNNGNGTFTKNPDIDMTPANFGGDSRRPWCQVADYDNDGLLDVVHNGPRSGDVAEGQLWRNTMTTSNNWIKLRVRGSGNNTDGLHAQVTVFEQGTTNIISYQQISAISAGYQNMLMHTGVGANANVDIRVKYPHGGAVCNFSNVAVNQDYVSFPTCNIQSYAPGSAIPLTYVAATPSVNTTMTLVADTAITPTTTELVTFALPFAQGDVTDLSEIKVSIGGSEVAAYVEQGLTWWADNSIRSATIQLQNVDMTAGNVTVTVDDTGFSTARLTEQPHNNGWVAAGADKNNHLYPRIFALHDKQYLADSGLIPPYDPAPDIDDAFETYQVAQFNNNFGALNYSTSTNSNWLFDRSSAMFKAYMTTGRVEFLKEAFLSKQFYFTYVRNDGTTPTAAGGDGCWTYGGTGCDDGKYIAPQQAKLALGLVGDNSQWDNSLIVEMALQADLGWSQYGSRDLFDNENEGFTERGAGLTGLAEVIAYEMTGDATILAHLNERIASLKDMQQTEKAWDTANGWTPKSGGWTHNIDVHEGNPGATLGDTNARGFSVWMTENIIDFLWQAYYATGNADAPEMMRLAANAVDDYGFTSVYNSGTGAHDELAEFTALGATSNRAQSCNTTRADTSLLYMTSSFADTATRTSGDWYPYYSDNHNIEVVLILAAGYKFETDSAKKTKLASRITKLIDGWTSGTCASTVFANVYRLFNWQHRSNSVRTWNRILREDV